MPEHRYPQFCVSGARARHRGRPVELLIVRELAPGPRRFTDLVAGLPGINRNSASGGPA